MEYFTDSQLQQEHKQLQLKLRETELSLTRATRIAKICTWQCDIHDPEDFFASTSTWSPEVYHLLDYKPQDLPNPIAKDYLDRVHPDDQLRLTDIVKRAQAEKRGWQAEYRLIAADGSERLVLDSADLFLNEAGQSSRVFGVLKDITAHKKTELALSLQRDELEEQVQHRTQALSDSMALQLRLNRSLRLLSQCGMAIVQAKDEHTLLNDLCRLICTTGNFSLTWVGMAQADAERTVLPVAQFGHASALLQSIQVIWKIEQSTGLGPTCTALRTGFTQVLSTSEDNPLNALWLEPNRAPGARSYAALPLWCEQQQLGVLVIHSSSAHGFDAAEVALLEDLARNIAFGLKTLRARQELNRHQLNLEELVTIRTAELSQAKAAADAANLAKGSFLATMSHELRTPLNAVIGLSGLLNDANLSHRQRDYTRKIQIAGQALRAVIDDILDFSKIEAGELHLEQAPFSLKALLHATLELVCVNLADKPIEYLIDTPPDLPDALLGDGLRLQQILFNLCSNAVKFTLKGELVFTVRCLAQTPSEATLQFSVRDTGIGIAGEQVATIFDAFTQGDSSISRNFGGTGLGLAISGRLVKLMGGRLHVHSTPGVGSEFYFQVTLARGPSASEAPPPERPRGLRLLIIDDHPLARALQTKNCSALGWQATALASGAEALVELLASAQQGRDYDVMLLDWRMPGMDGLQMLRQANATHGIGLPLVILMAATFELEQAALASTDLNLDGIVAKPLCADGLLQAINRAYAGEFTEILPLVSTAERHLSGMRLLVAEDNPLNHEVIKQILNQAGAEVVLAANGLAALVALRVPDEHFDAVLMDIQMPGMDGYTATRIIREEMGLLALPIIAVTAHARPEDRETSRLAGMTGHLLKPLDTQALLAIVSQARQAAKPDKVAVPVTLDIIHVLKMFAGDESKCLTMLHKLCAQHSEDIQATRHFLEVGNTAGAIKLLHDLGGVASFFQAQALANLSMAAETALLDGKPEHLPLLLDELEAAMQRLKAAIQGLEADHFKHPPESASPSDQADSKAALSH